MSSMALSLSPTVSTTSVSPSHLPTEYPLNVGSGSFGSGRPSRKICRYWSMYSSRTTSVSGVWMIFWRVKLAHARAGVIGRQRAIESSRDPFSFRCLTSASAQACIGSTSVVPPPMLMAPNGIPCGASMHPREAIASVHGNLSASQMPERSGVFPSASLGAGAVRFSPPDAVTGPFVRTSGHWADTVAAQQPAIARAVAIRPRAYMHASFCESALAGTKPRGTVNPMDELGELSIPASHAVQWNNELLGRREHDRQRDLGGFDGR